MLRFLHTRPPWRSGRPLLIATGAALAGLLLPGAVGAAWITNSIALDPGTCGRNLQVGANPTAAATAVPTFLLQGDGGLSSYAVTIDRKRVGTFRSTGGGVVCIKPRKPLADGPHLLTAVELAPNAGIVIRMRFSVDTVAPRRSVAAPACRLARTSELLTFSGVAGPGQPVHLIADGRVGIAGAVTDASGRWTATTVQLPAGTHAITAFALDTAGNKSAASRATTVTIAAAA